MIIAIIMSTVGDRYSVSGSLHKISFRPIASPEDLRHLYGITRAPIDLHQTNSDLPPLHRPRVSVQYVPVRLVLGPPRHQSGLTKDVRCFCNSHDGESSNVSSENMEAVSTDSSICQLLGNIPASVLASALTIYFHSKDMELINSDCSQLKLVANKYVSWSTQIIDSLIKSAENKDNFTFLISLRTSSARESNSKATVCFPHIDGIDFRQEWISLHGCT